MIIFLFIELTIAVVLGRLGMLHRSELDRAWSEWRQHPTAETREAFDKQKRIAEIERWGLSGVVFAVLVGVTVLVYRVKRIEKAATPNGHYQ